MMYGWNATWWPMMLMPLVWIVLIGLIVWAVMALSRSDGNRREAAPGRETPRELLDRRLAMGDIDSDKYRELRDVMEGGKGSGS